MDINNIYDLEKAGEELYKSLVKKFINTLDLISESIKNGTYIVNISNNIIKSHMEIAKELGKDIGVDWDVKIEYNDKSKSYIVSDNYNNLLSEIEKLKFYIEFQTKYDIKGKA
ncbi:MAG: hypothetical protein NC222_06780 [Staphylococcus sp.]|nr:hypothetical protein [Staphylococcus sp.]